MTQSNTKFLLLYFFFSITFILFVHSAHPTVKLDVGTIRGFTMKSRRIKADYFLGIPFAESPTGKNRFEKPVPVRRWKGIKDTTTTKPRCMQLVKKTPRSLTVSRRTSENCLYMNIVRPHNISTNNLMPVMLVIHGGGFKSGGASTYGVRANRGLALLKFNVILVSIQYRLGVYGFASTGKEDLPGNLGFFDQAEAVKFVHRNIKNFGGDPDRITLYGFSAGAASTTALSVAPSTRDLVSKVIAISGSSMAVWANSNLTFDSTHQLIKVLGLKANETVKQRLKRATHAEIYKATQRIGPTTYSQNFGRFTPRIDGDFFPKDIPALIEESPPKPIIIGMEKQESLGKALTSNPKTSKLAIPVKKRRSFYAAGLKDLITALISEKVYGNNTDEVRRKVFQYYSLPDGDYERDKVFYLQRYTQLMSDLQFNLAILQEILYRSYFGWKVFAYIHPYVNDDRSYKHYPIKESYHGADKQYANYIYGIHRARDEDSKMEKQTTQWIIKFVKTGNPSNPDFAWNSTDTSARSRFRFARLGPVPFMRDNFLRRRFRFWTKLAQEYKYDQVRMMPLNSTSLLSSVVI